MRIRVANAGDLPHLKSVEESAAKAFIGSKVGNVADRTVSPELLAKLVDKRTLWVAASPDNIPMGFAAAYPFDGFFYLHEISVSRECQGKGIGRRLMNVIEDYALDNAYPYIGLTTFRDIRWNGPFYKSLGYKEIAPDLYGGLHNKFMDDVRHGHDAAQRCVMIKVMEY